MSKPSNLFADLPEAVDLMLSTDRPIDISSVSILGPTKDERFLIFYIEGRWSKCARGNSFLDAAQNFLRPKLDIKQLPDLEL